MEIQKVGRYYKVHNTHGPVPTALKGLWTNPSRLETAVQLYSASVRAKTMTPEQRTERRRERAKAFLAGA